MPHVEGSGFGRIVATVAFMLVVVAPMLYLTYRSYVADGHAHSAGG